MRKSWPEMFTAPQHDAAFELLQHVFPEERGKAVVGIIARRRDWGVTVSFSPEEFTSCNTWNMLGEQDYVFAVEPGTNAPIGRAEARRRGELQFLSPGGIRKFSLEVRILPDSEAVEHFRSSLSS